MAVTNKLVGNFKEYEEGWLLNTRKPAEYSLALEVKFPKFF